MIRTKKKDLKCFNNNFDILFFQIIMKSNNLKKGQKFTNILNIKIIILKRGHLKITLPTRGEWGQKGLS